MKAKELTEALNTAAAAMELAARARLLYETLRQSAQQSTELTADESAALDARAEAIFAGPESQPSGR